MIRVVTDGIVSRGSMETRRTHEHSYRQFARARLSLDNGQGDVFEMYLDDAGNLAVRQLPRYNEAGETRTLYQSTAAERSIPTFDNWGATKEDEGVFYAISATESIGPYPTWAEANERARSENMAECSAYYSSKRAGSAHEETPRDGTSWCNVCGDISNLDPDSEAARQWHGDSFFGTNDND